MEKISGWQKCEPECNMRRGQKRQTNKQKQNKNSVKKRSLGPKCKPKPDAKMCAVNQNGSPEQKSAMYKTCDQSANMCCKKEARDSWENQ